jgi:hypothetical protein
MIGLSSATHYGNIAGSRLSMMSNQTLLKLSLGTTTQSLITLGTLTPMFILVRMQQTMLMDLSMLHGGSLPNITSPGTRLAQHLLLQRVFDLKVLGLRSLPLIKYSFIQDDQIIFWYRSHPKGVTCTTGDLPRNADFPADAIFALALLSSPANISLDVGSSHSEFLANAGATLGSVPFPTEDSQIPYLQIIRGGTQVKAGYGSMYITDACDYYNFNPWVGVIS